MLENLKNLNRDIEIYDIHSDEFKRYGRVLDIDTKEAVAACGEIERPESGSQYLMSAEVLENMNCAETIKELTFGGCDAQIGICHGYNSFLNGLEYHKSSEINIAATRLVLLLGLEYEMDGAEYDAAKVKGFYLERGNAIEVYATTLHFCPCQVSDSGFSCIVALPSGTNDVLEKPSDDKLLFRKNKWLICHDKNDALIGRGAYPGIHGVNYEIRYK